MKVYVIILLILLTPLTLCACAGGYRSDIGCAELGERIASSVPLDGGYFMQSENYLHYYFPEFEGDAAMFKSASNSSENEFGIFKSSGNANARALCERYIERQRSEYLSAKGNYTPQEYEKYKNAAVYTCGNYVIYTIMTPEDSASLLSGIRAILTD